MSLHFMGPITICINVGVYLPYDQKPDKSLRQGLLHKSIF